MSLADLFGNLTGATDDYGPSGLSEAFDFKYTNWDGTDYNEYIGKLQSLCLTKPAEYEEKVSKLKRMIIKALPEYFIHNIKTLLSEGRLNGKNIIVDSEISGKKSPKYPDQLTAEIYKTVGDAMKDITGKIIEILFPSEIMKTVGQKQLKMLGNQTINPST